MTHVSSLRALICSAVGIGAEDTESRDIEDDIVGNSCLIELGLAWVWMSP